MLSRNFWILMKKSLMHHNFTQSIIAEAKGSYMQNSFAYENLIKRFPLLGELGEELACIVIDALYALISHARTRTSTGKLRPFLNVQVQVWMRELTIKVTGKGKIAVKPDKIRLYVNKEELCKEYEDTLRRSTEDTELLKDLFEKLGFQRKDLKTVYFNVDTEYESYQDRDKSWKRRFKGYKYNHHMKIEFAADNKRLGQVLYALAHSSLRPEFSIEYTVADVEKCKNELLHKAIEDSIQKAQVLTTAANVKLGEIQAIDYSWGEIDFVTKPLNEMRLMECTECEMSAPGAYDIDIEADDINVTDTATVIWEIA